MAAFNRRTGLAAFDFPDGALILTEAGSKRRASIHLVSGASSLAAHDPGGLEVLEADAIAFREALRRQRHTCPGCQTGGRILADRPLSRLLKDDWPRSMEELESRGLGTREE